MEALKELSPDHDLDHLHGTLKFIKNFNVAIDIGAHKGIWTKELLKHFKTVHSFEPFPEHYLELSKINPNSYNCALGSNDDFVGMKQGPHNTGQTYINGKGMIRVCRLDNFYEGKVDFIKIDVEGYELYVLYGGIFTILDSKPVIMLEDNGLSERYGIKTGQAGLFLKALGYELVAKFNKDYVYRYRSARK